MARKTKPNERGDAYGSANFAAVGYDDPGGAQSGVFFGQLKTREWFWTRNRRILGPKKEHQPPEFGPLIYSKPESNALICAPAGAGKGTSVIIPMLLRYEGSVFTIDPKGENAAVTARHRMALGSRVHVVNPWNLHAAQFAQLGIPSSRFNPLDLLDPDDPNVVSTANFITELCVVPTHGAAGQHHESYWDESAKQLILGLLLYIVANYPPEERNLALLRRLVTQSYEDLAKTFQHMGASQAFSGALQEAGNQFIGMDPRPLSSIVSTAQTNTKFLTDPIIKDSLSASDFSFADLKHDRATVFVIIPAYELETQSRWLRLMVGMAVTAMERSAPGPGHRCLFLLDEFAALGPLKKIQSGIATLRGYGVDMALVLQDLGQLRQLYTHGADTILANCAFKHFMRISDKTTADYVSAMLGNETVTVRSGNQAHANFAGTGRALQTADELMNSAVDTGYLIKAGSRPIMLQQIRYFDERTLAKHADPNPMYRG